MFRKKIIIFVCTALTTMITTSEETDIQTLSRLRSGSEEAFDGIFRKYYKPLKAYAVRFVETEDAEDIVQTLLLWLWENRRTLSIRTSLSSYLFLSVHHRCISCINSGKSKRRTDAVYWEKMPDFVGIETEAFELEKLVRQLNEAIESLPQTYREAIVLHRFHGLTYAEIASRAGVSAKTVDYRIQKAIKTLRVKLKDSPILLYCSFSSAFDSILFRKRGRIRVYNINVT